MSDDETRTGLPATGPDPRAREGSRPPAGPPRPGEPGARPGSSALEYTGMLPLLLLVALAAIQLGIVAYAVQQAGTGARAAARVASHEDYGRHAAAGRAAMSGWTASRSSFALSRRSDEVDGHRHRAIPSLVPGMDSFGEAPARPRCPPTRTPSDVPGPSDAPGPGDSGARKGVGTRPSTPGKTVPLTTTSALRKGGRR